ncbi:MAG: hypothetical protein LUG83_06640 [Lachnospiraceae bacterium]|nr:hypothetical protein [Lachnospiraceae bacterium]
MQSVMRKILTAAVFVMLAVYLFIFVYLNMAKYVQHVDSDIAAETLLAREIWTEKTLTPDDWIGSTERYIFGMPAVASVFYGLTGSMTMAAGLACVLIGAVFCAVFYFSMKKLGFSRVASATALLILCALPINGIRNDGQLVPFMALLLFVFADYYALHAILMLLTIVFYFHVKYHVTTDINKTASLRCMFGRKEILCWAGIFLFSTAISMGGQRCLQMVILPMAAVEAISLFVESGFFSRALPKKRYIATCFVASLVLSGLIGGLRKGQAQYTMYLNDSKEIMERLFITVPAAVLEGFGISGNARVGNFTSLMQMLIWAFLALVIFALVYIFVIDRKSGGTAARQRETIAILSMSFGITVFIIVFTTAEPAHNYFMFAWFAAAITVAALIDRLTAEGSWFSGVIMLAVCVFALLNIKYTYYEAVTTTDNLAAYEEVADFMLEEGIEYGYAEFWDAGRIALVRDGAVTMGCSYSMSELKMYWWITSLKWYPPALPEEMKTAYVVRIGKKEDFLEQFTDGEIMELEFENELFAVYVSDRNYVTY